MQITCRTTTLHSNAEQEEEPATAGLLTTTDNSASDVVEEDDAQSDDDDADEEKAMKKWLSTTYGRGSKKPMKMPLTAQWGLPITNADVAKLNVKLSRGAWTPGQTGPTDLMQASIRTSNVYTRHDIRRACPSLWQCIVMTVRCSNSDGWPYLFHTCPILFC